MMNVAFTNQEEAEEYVLYRLTEKYKKTFQIVGKGKLCDNGFAKFYVCDFQEAGEVQHIYKARAIQNGVMEDDFALFFYRREAEDFWENAVQKLTHFKMLSHVFKAPITSATWNGTQDFADYCKNAKVYYKVVLQINLGYEMEEYIEELMTFQKNCEKLFVPVELKIRTEEKDILWVKLWDIKKKDKPFSKEYFQKNLENNM